MDIVTVVSPYQILSRNNVESLLKSVQPDFRNAKFILYSPSPNGKNSFAINKDMKAFTSTIREQFELIEITRQKGVNSCIALITPLQENMFGILKPFSRHIFIFNIDSENYPTPNYIKGCDSAFDIFPQKETFCYEYPKVKVTSSYETVSSTFDKESPSYESSTISVRRNVPPLEIRIQNNGFRQESFSKECLSREEKNLKSISDSVGQKRKCEDYSSEINKKQCVIPTPPPIPPPSYDRQEEYKGKEIDVYTSKFRSPFKIILVEEEWDYRERRYVKSNFLRNRGVTRDNTIFFNKEVSVEQFNLKLFRKYSWKKFNITDKNAGKLDVAGFFNHTDFAVPIFMTFFNKKIDFFHS